jgi:arylformamidase
MSNSVIDRRALLGASVGVVAGVAGVARADETQLPSSVDSPKVWLDLDQAALDAAYDQTVYAPNFAQIVKRMETNSALMRMRIGEPQVFSYGTSLIEKLFYYPAKTANAPIHIHVHWGAWRQRRAEDILFPAENFINAGIGFAVYDFTAVDETNGDLKPMLAQVCGGLAWVAQNARKLGGDPNRLYVSGFSSGAHLASVAMIADWSQFGLAKNPYKGAVLVSGMYDLHPVRLSKRSNYVAFTDEVEESMSAQRHVEKCDIPVILAHGTYETPEFQRQTRDFAAALKSAGKSAQYLVHEGYNHYEMMESFGNPYGPIGRAAVAQIHLSS